MGWWVLEYHQRIAQIFPKGNDPSLPCIVPDHVRIEEWWEFSKEMLESLWKTLPAKRKTANIIRYQKKLHPTDAGRVSYRNSQFCPVLLDFSEMDLVKQSDIDRMLTNESAKLDVFPKHKSAFGSVLVKPILGFPDIPDKQTRSAIFNSVLIRAKNYIWHLIWTKLLYSLTILITILGLWVGLLAVQPIAQIAGADPISGYAPLEVRFSNVSSNADNYRWQLDETTTSDDFQPIHIFEEPGEYTVTLYASRSPNWPILGFTNSDTIVVHVLPTEFPTSDTSGDQIDVTNALESPTVTNEISITPSPP